MVVLGMANQAQERANEALAGDSRHTVPTADYHARRIHTAVLKICVITSNIRSLQRGVLCAQASLVPCKTSQRSYKGHRTRSSIGSLRQTRGSAGEQ